MCHPRTARKTRPRVGTGSKEESGVNGQRQTKGHRRGGRVRDRPGGFAMGDPAGIGDRHDGSDEFGSVAGKRKLDDGRLRLVIEQRNEHGQ